MMLGFCAGACACAGLTSPGMAASNNPAANAPSLGHVRCRAFILCLRLSNFSKGAGVIVLVS